MREELIAMTALVAAAAGMAFFVWLRLRRRDRLPASAHAQLRRQWAHAASLQDPVRRVLEAEKVIDRLLQALGYAGSFGEKLKAAGPRLPNIDAVWTAHKLRNHLAHEPGAAVSKQDADRALRAFQGALDQYVR